MPVPAVPGRSIRFNSQLARTLSYPLITTCRGTRTCVRVALALDKKRKIFYRAIIHRQHAAGFGDNNENTVFLSFLSSTTHRTDISSFSSLLLPRPRFAPPFLPHQRDDT